MNNNLLPLGTIIKIHNSDNLYIILGTFCKIDNKMYTYYGLILDNGEINNKVENYDVYINQDEIKEIIFLGNVNSEV